MRYVKCDQKSNIAGRMPEKATVDALDAHQD